jgi:CopA family copper-resistance protein
MFLEANRASFYGAGVCFEFDPINNPVGKGIMRKEKATEGRLGQPISRRCFVQGLAAGGAIAAFPWRVWPAFADALPQSPAALRGSHFDLVIHSMAVNFTGHRAWATAVNGSVPGPTLRWREGDTITLAVTNRLKTSASIHWHGVRVPAPMDGVPGLSYPGIAPSETFVYRIPVKQSGTYWYHSHSRFQEQTGLLGALILERSDKDPIESDREHVVMLTDWTDTNPETLFSNLKQQSDYYNFHQRTLGTFFADVKKRGLGRTISDRLTWGRMNMSPTDIADVTGAAYTYLMNGHPPNANWTGVFQPGERVRLRFINGSSMTFFDVRIPGLSMTVVQADGNDVEPVTVDEFRIGVAETYDVIVQPRNDAAYTIFAQAEDRTGFARGTLAPRPGMTAAVPPLDPRPLRTMVDMGMGGMPGMNMAGIDGMKSDDMQGMPGMDMSDDGTTSATPPAPTSAGASIPAQDMAGMQMGSPTGTTPFPQPGPRAVPLVLASGGTHVEQSLEPSNPVRLRLGPQVDMISKDVTERLNDPGDGLTGNGRRVLSYADLRARYRGVDPRPPSREIELHLTGNMERYIWGFNGEKFSSAQPVELKLGERVRIVLVNDTMMEHPIHLHGLWSELENGHGEFNPYKHTVIVKPSERVSYLVSADTPGKWAYHCHLLYHMEAGMFRTVVVS